MTTNSVLVPLASLTPQLGRLETLTAEIEEAKGLAKQFEQVGTTDIDALADKYSKSSSSFLAGVVGGCAGAAGGIALSTSAGVALVLSGPVGLAAGVALGILAFRGKTYWRLERSTQKTVGAMNLLLAQISALPPDAPADVRDELYRQYRELTQRYGSIARDSLDEAPHRLRDAGRPAVTQGLEGTGPE